MDESVLFNRRAAGGARRRRRRAARMGYMATRASRCSVAPGAAHDAAAWRGFFETLQA